MRKLIIANWKMNGSKELVEKINLLDPKHANIIICPPYPFLGAIKNDKIQLGAQDITKIPSPNGAFTGEVSGEILKSIGVNYVIIGHSERRDYFKEKDAILTAKINNAIHAGLKVIYCIGESLEDYKLKNTKEVILKQLRLINKFNKHYSDFIIAYEPIWSIGTGLVADYKDIEKIVSWINNMFDHKMKIVYGGSVNQDNAENMLKSWPIDGVLVGGASLKMEEFQHIISYCR